MDLPNTGSAPAASTSSTPSAPAAPTGQSTSAAAASASNTQAPQAGTPNLSGEMQAAPQGETVAERKARLLKYKVDGKEYEFDADEVVNSDDALIAMQQKAMAGMRRMEEAAKTRKAYADLEAAIRQDPVKALQEAWGLDVRKMVEDQLIQEFKAQQLPENERVLYQKEQQLAAREAQIRAREEQAQRAYQQQLEQQMLAATEAEFAQALDTELVPRNRQTMAMMAQVAAAALEHGIELTPRQLATEVNNRLRESTQHVFRGMKGEQLVKYLGPDIVKEILQYQYQQHKARAVAPTEPAVVQQPAAGTAEPTETTKQSPVERMRANDYFRSLKY